MMKNGIDASWNLWSIKKRMDIFRQRTLFISMKLKEDRYKKLVGIGFA
jgi:hypothetical protein